MNETVRAGLVANGVGVPLEGVRIEGRTNGPCVEVTVAQRYRNHESVPVEAVYVFPLEEGAAVCGFAARVGDKLIRGKVEERERAFEMYDDAMMDGNGAFLLDQERPNVFTASVGNLRPNEVVELQISYVAIARREGDALRFGIPTTVSPRYVPKATRPEVGQPDGERVNPEHWLAVPYGLTLSFEVDAPSLRRVESPSHPVRTTLREGGATVELAQDEPQLDRDFVLIVESADPNRPFAMVAREDDGRRVAMVSFLPDLAPDASASHEVVFLLDCSGSMQGESIEQAKRALLLCIRALSENDSFNVVRFGSTHQSMWRSSRRFDDRSLSEATKYVQSIQADLGGTEILPALRDVLHSGGELRERASAQRVLLLTDGQVSNEADVIALARQNETRIFAFGIGAGASEHLVRGVARASRGAADMIFPGERIEPKVLRMFDRVRTPALDDVRVDWAGMSVEQSPGRTPPIFAGDALTVFARIESGAANEVALSAGDRRWSVPIDLERPIGYRDSAKVGVGAIPTLWARERIRELEDETQPRGSAQRRPEREDRTRKKLIELGTRYGLLSSATSYVAIEERPSSERTDRPAELRRIPVALTTGWGCTFAVGGRARMAAAPAAMPMGAPMMRAPAPMAPGTAAPPAPASVVSRASGGGFFGALRKVFGENAARLEEADAEFGSPAQSGTARPDRLFELLMTQRASGSFPVSGELESWLGVRAERLQKALEVQRNLALGDPNMRRPDAIVATSVVIALLEREAKDRESEWRPAVTKAKAWLAAQGASFDPSPILA